MSYPTTQRRRPGQGRSLCVTVHLGNDPCFHGLHHQVNRVWLGEIQVPSIAVPQVLYRGRADWAFGIDQEDDDIRFAVSHCGAETVIGATPASPRRQLPTPTLVAGQTLSRHTLFSSYTAVGTSRTTSLPDTQSSSPTHKHFTPQSPWLMSHLRKQRRRPWSGAVALRHSSSRPNASDGTEDGAGIKPSAGSGPARGRTPHSLDRHWRPLPGRFVRATWHRP